MANSLVSKEHSQNELTDALGHLANAAISDKTTLANLTIQMALINRQNQLLIEQNGMLIATIAALTGAKQMTTKTIES